VTGETGLGLLLASAVFLVALRLRPSLLEAVDRRFFREQYDARRTLRSLVERCRRIRGRGELARVVQHEVDRALHVDSLELLLLDESTGVLYSADGAVRPLAAASRLCRYVEFQSEPVCIDVSRPPAGRRARPEDWAAAAGQVARCLYDLGPDMIFMPHEADWNQTHVGVHHLTLKALRRLPADFACLVVETEFWGMMASPNLMVESPARDVADLVQALACHAGEIARNPYHLRLPAWMIDNVRRGSELVLGQGASAPSIAFATLYRLGRWSEGMLRPVIPSSACLGGGADLAQEIP
jgi:hypothetical protein